MSNDCAHPGTLRFALLVLILGFYVWPSLVTAQGEELASGPLADYVGQTDASYNWQKRREGRSSGVSFVELTLTSQTWKDSVWKHQLFVIRPDRIRDSQHALLLIDGGSWNDELAGPPQDDEKLPQLAALLATVASRLQTPIAVLKQVPHSPMFGGMEGRTAISHTFEQFLKTEDPTWPMLLPMVKSAVRGMDAVQEFAKQEWSMEIEHFILTGASQRGWTTWLTAAIDLRVEALAPMVIDVLNMGPQMQHQVATFGATSSEIAAYNNRGISQLSTPIGEQLRSIVDPFSYRQALSQPKLIVLATNDENSPLDALNLYWDELIGEKHILYVPNNTHEIKDFPRIAGSIAALYRRATRQLVLPELTWRFDETADSLQIRIASDRPPAKVVVWGATSPTRDFRKAIWRSTPAKVSEGEYYLEIPRPASGCAAAIGEAQFADKTLPYFFSTNVRIMQAREESAQ